MKYREMVFLGLFFSVVFLIFCAVFAGLAFSHDADMEDYFDTTGFTNIRLELHEDGEINLDGEMVPWHTHQWCYDYMSERGMKQGAAQHSWYTDELPPPPKEEPKEEPKDDEKEMPSALDKHLSDTPDYHYHSDHDDNGTHTHRGHAHGIHEWHEHTPLTHSHPRTTPPPPPPPIVKPPKDDDDDEMGMPSDLDKHLADNPHYHYHSDHDDPGAHTHRGHAHGIYEWHEHTTLIHSHPRTPPTVKPPVVDPPPPDEKTDEEKHREQSPDFHSHNDSHVDNGFHTHRGHIHDGLGFHEHTPLAHSHPVEETEIPKFNGVPPHTHTFLPPHSDHEAHEPHAHYYGYHSHDGYKGHGHNYGFYHEHEIPEKEDTSPEVAIGDMPTVPATVPVESELVVLPEESAPTTSVENPNDFIIIPTVPTVTVELVETRHDIVLTEIMFHDNGMLDTPQWFELHNRGEASNLSGWAIRFSTDHQSTNNRGGELTIVLGDHDIEQGESLVVTSKQAQSWEHNIENYTVYPLSNLKNQWTLYDRKSMIIHQRLGEWQHGWNTKLGGNRRSAEIIPTRPAPTHNYYGLRSDVGTPGWHEDVAPAAPALIRNKAVMWGQLKGE